VIRIAAIGSIQHGELLAVLAQDGGDALEHAGALERRHVAPFVERFLGRRHRRVDVVGTAIRDRPQRFTGAWIDGVGAPAGFGLVPGAAVIGAAMLGQDEGLRLDGFERDCGIHADLPSCVLILSLPGSTRQSRLEGQSRASLSEMAGTQPCPRT
jgi:hypothetical protein